MPLDTGVIDREEFKACYASMPWNRVNGLARLLEEIKVRPLPAS